MKNANIGKFHVITELKPLLLYKWIFIFHGVGGFVWTLVLIPLRPQMMTQLFWGGDFSRR
jgi:hypothetical protein